MRELLDVLRKALLGELHEGYEEQVGANNKVKCRTIGAYNPLICFEKSASSFNWIPPHSGTCLRQPQGAMFGARTWTWSYILCMNDLARINDGIWLAIERMDFLRKWYSHVITSHETNVLVCLNCNT